jgi:hypothetical protein
MENDLTCAICGKAMSADIEQAIEEGWQPSFWIDEAHSTGPACADCSAQYLCDHDNEPILRPGIMWPINHIARSNGQPPNCS